MPRWLLKLKGDTADLEELPYWFPSGLAMAFSEGESVYLTVAELDALTDAREVSERARSTLEEMSAVISLLWPSYAAPTIEHVVHEADNGTRLTHHVLMASGVVSRSKVRASLGPRLTNELTSAQWLLQASKQSSHLQTALLLWADSNRTWPRLYRVLEEVEQHVGQNADRTNLYSAAERTLFTRCANTAAVAGKDSRHADGKFEPPANPMSLNDASRFIGGVVQRCLDEESRRLRAGAAQPLVQAERQR